MENKAGSQRFPTRRSDLAARYPILTEHWGDLPDATSDNPPPHIRALKLRRDVEKLHRLPPRVTFELLCEIGRARGIQTVIEDRTAAFARVNTDALAATGGDVFAPSPIHEAGP